MLFDYSINWIKTIKDNLPLFYHAVWRITWIEALIKPVKDMYAEFIALQTVYIYKVRFNGQICYLETILNEKFDPIGNGIYITDAALSPLYLYKKVELKPPRYLYRKWSSTHNYVVGEFAQINWVVYEAVANNTNQYPPTSMSWVSTTKTPMVLRKKVNFLGTISFIVNVPNALVYDQNAMRSLINYYKLAGKSYIIQTY